jgi:hypothetical protein
MGPFLNTIGCLNGMVEDLKVQAKVTNWSQPQPGGPVTVDLTYSIIDDSIMDPGRDASSCELMIYYPGPDHFYVPSQPPTMDRTIGEHSVSFTFTPDGTGTYYLLLHAMNSWGGYEKGHRNKPAVTNGVKGTYDGTTWTWQGSLF